MDNNININQKNDKSYTVKIIYGILGGVQSVLHILSGFLDIFYIFKEFKIYILENIFKGIKYIINALRHILTFKFINNTGIRLISNIIISFGFSLCLIIVWMIKKEKSNKLNDLVNQEKNQLKLYINNID